MKGRILTSLLAMMAIAGLHKNTLFYAINHKNQDFFCRTINY